jgi:hypothetical protein
MKAVRASETSVYSIENTRRYIPEDSKRINKRSVYIQPRNPLKRTGNYTGLV